MSTNPPSSSTQLNTSAPMALEDQPRVAAATEISSAFLPIPPLVATTQTAAQAALASLRAGSPAVRPPSSVRPAAAAPAVQRSFRVASPSLSADQLLLDGVCVDFKSTKSAPAAASIYSSPSAAALSVPLERSTRHRPRRHPQPASHTPPGPATTSADHKMAVGSTANIPVWDPPANTRDRADSPLFNPVTEAELNAAPSGGNSDAVNRLLARLRGLNIQEQPDQSS